MTVFDLSLLKLPLANADERPHDSLSARGCATLIPVPFRKPAFEGMGISSHVSDKAALITPDRRYVVINGRLWRASNPALDNDTRHRASTLLAAARANLRRESRFCDREALANAQNAIRSAKMTLGELGPVWWRDGAPDLSKQMARDTCYAAWFSGTDSLVA